MELTLRWLNPVWHEIDRQFTWLVVCATVCLCVCVRVSDELLRWSQPTQWLFSSEFVFQLTMMHPTTVHRSPEWLFSAETVSVRVQSSLINFFPSLVSRPSTISLSTRKNVIINPEDINFCSADRVVDASRWNGLSNKLVDVKETSGCHTNNRESCQ